MKQERNYNKQAISVIAASRILFGGAKVSAFALFRVRACCPLPGSPPSPI